MITIYHNPRCSKSRQGLQILENSRKDFTVIKYLETNLTEDELKAIISKLGVAPLDVVRQNEAIWKSDYKGKALSDEQIISAMVKHPKLIERPIVIHNNKGVIGRPPEAILNIL